MSVAAVKRLWSSPDLLGVEWADGTSSEFASIWLRDNLRDDRDPHSGQRLIDIADLPEDPRISSAVAQNGAVQVEWEGESRTGAFELEWLLASAANPLSGRAAFAPKLWLDAADRNAARDFAWATFADAHGNRALRAEWLTRLLQDGIAFLRDVSAAPPPSAAPADSAGLPDASLEMVLDAASLLGSVSETNYGRVFEVRSVPQPENLAYSDLGLGLHTDNPYREPVPGFQVLHVLRL